MFKKLLSTQTKPGAFFRPIDWTAFWGATLIAFLVYLFTLGPSVGLEDSGELATAADHLGVPHPPGYPFWSLCSWIFCRLFSWVTYMGQPTPAWSVSLFSAVAGAFAAGCTAMLICRSGSDMLDSIDANDTEKSPSTGASSDGLRRTRNAFVSLAGGLGGSLIFAFSPVEWSQSTIVEIYSLNALFLMAVFLLSYRWMRKPSDKILWLTAFVFGLGLTNYQVLLLAALPLVIIIMFRNISLFWDFVVLLIPVALTAQVLKIGSMMRASYGMSGDVINKHAAIREAVTCPNGTCLWIGCSLLILAPFLHSILRRFLSDDRKILFSTIGAGFGGVAFIFLSILASSKVSWAKSFEETSAPLIQPTTYAVIGLFLAACCACAVVVAVLSDGKERKLVSDRTKPWLIGLGCCALLALAVAGSTSAAGDNGYTGIPFSWSMPNLIMLIGLAVLVALTFFTPNHRGLLFAVPVATVQLTVYILLQKGAMNGLSDPNSWWFFWPIVWNFMLLGLAFVSLPNGRSIAPTLFFAELGVSFYVYMPIVSDLRNPPMNWGYPRTWEGFKHAITRGQYEAIKMPPLFTPRGFSNIIQQMGFYMKDLRLQFTLVAASLALIPFTLWNLRAKIGTRLKAFSMAQPAVCLYAIIALLVIVFSELLPQNVWGGEVPLRLDKLFLALLALMVLVGVYFAMRQQILLLFSRPMQVLSKKIGRNAVLTCLAAVFGLLAAVVLTALLLTFFNRGFATGVSLFSMTPVQGLPPNATAAQQEAFQKVTLALPVFRLLCLAIVATFAAESISLLVKAGILRGPLSRINFPECQFRADDVSQQWLLSVGTCFALMSLVLVALANVRGDIQDGFIQKVKFISSHGMFSLWIGYGLAVGITVVHRFIERRLGDGRINNVIFGVLCMGACCVALIPIYENYTNKDLVFAMGSAEQNGHTFGWQFGNYQLRGANAIREELTRDEEPLPNPQWPEEMEFGSIFFGGTDPGRFVPTYMIYSANVRPDIFLITQNALADDTYMSVERDLYGNDIWIPSKEDSAESFNIYVEEVKSGKRQANADLRIENGRVQVTGALGVMEINGFLTRAMFDHEKERRSFYLEESYVIPWMYPFLTPHGLIMKINKDERQLTSTILRNDMEFWDWYTRRLLHDPAFRRDFPAQKSFSKLRAAIAGLYAETARKMPVDSEFRKATDQAFREAVLLYPASPEASFRYIQEVLFNANRWAVIHDMLDYTDRKDPENQRTKLMRDSVTKVERVSEKIKGYQLRLKDPKNSLSAAEYLDFANCYLGYGSAQAATSLALEAVKRSNPLDAEIACGAIALLVKVQRNDIAAEILGHASSIPNLMSQIDPESLHQLAGFFLKQNQWPQADQMLNAYLKKVQSGPQATVAWIERAMVKLARNDRTAAQSALSKAMRLDPQTTRQAINSTPALKEIADQLFQAPVPHTR